MVRLGVSYPYRENAEWILASGSRAWGLRILEPGIPLDSGVWNASGLGIPYWPLDSGVRNTSGLWSPY